MTEALTPAVALAYLRELSADFQAGLVLDGAGTRLAGDEALLPAARALLAALAPGESLAPGEADEACGSSPVAGGGTGSGALLFAARRRDVALVAAYGPLALAALVRHDLETVLDRLDRPAEAPRRKS